MKNLVLGASVMALLLTACNQQHPANIPTTQQTTDTAADKKEITSLVRRMLNWAESKNGFCVLPVLTNDKDSVYIGFDLEKHEQNIKKLKETNLFTVEFINNYDSIIRTLDRKLRNHEFETWLVGDLPTFGFANDVDPWCYCQDVPYDKPNPWDEVKMIFEEMNSNRATLAWKWDHCVESDKSFEYPLRVIKENGKWKIAWLYGFDYAESTK